MLGGVFGLSSNGANILNIGAGNWASAASNLVGICRAQDGHTLAFAFLMNRIYPGYAHPIQSGMVVAVARYNG